MKFTKNVVAYFVVGSLTLTSCQTANPYTGESQQAKATTGAIIGGLFGAGIGALSGGSNTERKQRALLGAGVGALAGSGIGAYMDKQESELRRELEGAGVGISRNGNQITLVMPGDITFSTGSSGIVGQFYPTLASWSRLPVIPITWARATIITGFPRPVPTVWLSSCRLRQLRRKDFK
jgi:hypothetical protein